MAWTDQCKFDAQKQFEHFQQEGLNKTATIKKLSEESGIPEATLDRWLWPRSQEVPSKVTESGSTPSQHTKSPQNKEIRKGLTVDGKPRQRASGAGRKPKYKRRAKQLPPEDIVDHHFLKAWRLFVGAITDAQRSRWTTTSKAAVLHYLDSLYDIVNLELKETGND